MHKLTTFVTGCTLAAVLFAGCSNEPKRAERNMDKTTPSVSETERPGSAAPSDITPATAMARISDLRIGSALGSDGKVAENVDNLHAGETIYASIAVGDVGSSSKIKAVWLGPDGVRISDEIQSVVAGAAFLVFKAPNTSGWSVGNYKVEIFLGDELASSEGFDIVLRVPA